MKKTTIAIAGASGFVGSHLIRALGDDVNIVGLARTAREPRANVAWRSCDLYSSSSAQSALAGADIAVYLVHSMMPSSRLFQGHFHDTDLLLAHNFAKACVHAGVRQIIYLGGLVPPAGYVSPHLQSRHEVEGVLKASGIPVTCLRAGMVVGPGGSSFEILRALVERLPWMILPKWTQSQGQAVFIDDVVSVLKAAMTDPVFIGRTFDVVNGETLTYESLLRQTAKALGKRRFMLRVPIASTGFSKRWVQLFSGASHELVAPLIDSLQCDLPQVSPGAEIAALVRYKTFASMLEETLKRGGEHAAHRSVNRIPPPRRSSTVRSIQRLPAMPNHAAHFISNEYMTWLPRFFRAIIRVSRLPGSHRIVFSLLASPRPLLVLDYIADDSDGDRDMFHIVGGCLSKADSKGWLEFRQIADKRYTLASIHEFAPALPWGLYIVTQAPIHAWVMRRFGRHLARIKQET